MWRKLDFSQYMTEVFGLPRTLFRSEQAKNTYKTDGDHVNELRIFRAPYVTFIWVN